MGVSLSFHQPVQKDQWIPNELETSVRLFYDRVCRETNLSKDGLASRCNKISQNSHQEVRYRKADDLPNENIIWLSSISLKIGGIGDKSSAASKTQEQEPENEIALLGALDR